MHENSYYEDRIVIFIDILGFKDSIKKSINDSTILNNIYLVINNMYNEYNFNNAIKKFDLQNEYEISVFSDSIIYSAPLKNNLDIYYMFSMVECLLRKIISFGFVARGGVSIGKMIHYDGIAFGPALVESVELESKAIYPRIIFSEATYKNLISILKKNNKKNCDDDIKQFRNLFYKFSNETHEKFFYLDYIAQSNEFECNDDYINFLSKAKKIVEDGIATQNNKHIKEKYVWLKIYIKNVCLRKKIHYKHL